MNTLTDIILLMLTVILGAIIAIMVVTVYIGIKTFLKPKSKTLFDKK